MQNIEIFGRKIGQNESCFIVAEISANHNQNLDEAKKIISAAKKAGADAIKLQTYTPDTLTINSDQNWFQIDSDNLWNGKTLYELYSEAYTPWEWHQELFDYAANENIICFSTPFDETSVDFLEKLDVPIYKVASFEVVDLPLLRKIGSTHKPVIMSTGMASINEISEAVKTLRESGSGPIAVLKCTSAYPAPPESMNLKTIPHLRDTFDVIVGLSDHTLGSAVPVAAIALGASIIEKHFINSRAHGGPDAFFSLEPHEFEKMVQDIRQAEKALGKISYELTPAEVKNLSFRRSLFVIEDIKKGDPFLKKNIRSIRPGHGLPPRYLDIILEKFAAQDIPRGTPLRWDLIGS